MLPISHNVSLSANNTLGLASLAANYAAPTDHAQLIALLQYAVTAGMPVHVLGSGSNVLLAPVIQGLVVQPNMQGMAVVQQTDTHVWVQAGAGVAWHDFVCHCVGQQWYGVENLSLIPGKVGASPIQNIGAYGVEVKDTIAWVQAVEIATGELVTLLASDCQFGYRDSVFKQQPNRWVIVNVVYKLSLVAHFKLDYGDLAATVGDAPTIERVAAALIAIRQSKLPSVAALPNAGSYFKNPIVDTAVAEALKAEYPTLPVYPGAAGTAKLAAGWLIEQAGWRGKSIGKVGMYDKQALVLVNYGGAALADILAVEQAVVADVQAKFAVALEREPVLLR